MKVSVCMATYNGQKYIRQQLNSILNQSVMVDEICIVDDCSTDETLRIIEEYKSSQFIIIRNKKNMGYVKSFERSIEASSGDIIILSDQDDVWSLNKVEKLLHYYKNNPKVKVICHAAIVVDRDNVPILGLDINYKPGFYGKYSLAREFVKPRFFGCVCSFHSSLKLTYLPFNDYVYTHDHWLSINGFLSGGFLVVPDRLINYRRHTGALTKHKPDPIIERLANRYKFLCMVVIYFYRKFKKRIYNE